MKNFYFISSDIQDPYFNIASEEYLLRQTTGYYIYLWRNAPAVIVGVNQNTPEEVNIAYTEQHGIKVVRRMTGGGAVYHDPNNICYTVIAPYNKEEDHYRVFTRPVIEYLNRLGVTAEFSGRNDIAADGKKISGNAETVYGDRILHHGTLLFDTDMTALSQALKPNKLKMESKGIKSVRARVTNIKECLGSPMTAQAFFDGLCDFFLRDCTPYTFSRRDMECIEKLVREKYATFEWNVGRSPKGENVFEGRFSFGMFSLSFDTENGRVHNARIHGDFFTGKDINELAEKLNGTAFEKRALTKAFDDVGDYIKGATAEEIIERMF